ncbi:MAG TPA: glutathione S-transferase family protein [Rhizomicrobium sp.]|nr:glutathione S-transferase family protein [Rhizomicrobium sp.]
MALILYGSALSPLVRKVRIILAEKALDYTLEQAVLPTPGLARMSPLMRIPVLRDTGQPEPNTLPESWVIADYLEQKWPVPALYPRHAFARAQALWLQDYADTHLAPTIGTGLFNERVMKRLTGGECEEAVVDATLSERLPPIFDHLEKTLSGRTFLVGDALSVADIAVGSALVNFRHSGVTIDATRWPSLGRHIAALYARPSFQNCIEAEQRFLKRQSAAR